MNTLAATWSMQRRRPVYGFFAATPDALGEIRRDGLVPGRYFDCHAECNCVGTTLFHPLPDIARRRGNTLLRFLWPCNCEDHHYGDGTILCDRIDVLGHRADNGVCVRTECCTSLHIAASEIEVEIEPGLWRRLTE